MNLYIIRHAIAVDREEHRGKDAGRPLSQQGRRKMRRIARGMRRLGLRFDVVSRELSQQNTVSISANLAPGKNAAPLLASLADRNQKSVLLVGHEPQLSRLISTLVSGSGALSLTMKKGGLCRLTVAHPGRPGTATLEWLITPSQLAALR
jgi:phosphohistidine phosphatase